MASLDLGLWMFFYHVLVMCAVVCTSQSKPSNSTSVDYERLAEAVNTANSTWVVSIFLVDIPTYLPTYILSGMAPISWSWKLLGVFFGAPFF
jgi:hypothetical protein